MRLLPPFVLTLLLGVLAGCGADDAAKTDPAKPAVQNEQRRMLNEGYSMLYTDASGIAKIKLVLFVKFESEEFNKLLTAISDYGDELRKELERVAKDYPAVRIDLEPLPEMEKRKRTAIGKERAIKYLPLSGRSRLDYERTMLLGMSNAVNHEGHLCQVMAEEEPDPGLKKILSQCQKRYAALYQMAIDMLNRHHFRSTVERKNTAGPKTRTQPDDDPGATPRSRKP